MSDNKLDAPAQLGALLKVVRDLKRLTTEDRSGAESLLFGAYADVFLGWKRRMPEEIEDHELTAGILLWLYFRYHGDWDQMIAHLEKKQGTL